MPSIERGGVEKNLFLISNFLSLKLSKINFITSSNNTHKLNKNINIISLKLFNLFNNRILKTFFSSILLIFELIKDRNVVVFSFQANLFAILIAKIFKVKILIRLNSSPSGWINKNWKKKIFKSIYSLSDLIIVNSVEFRNEIWKKLKIKSHCIYNPLDKNLIIKNSKLKINKKPFNISRALKIINVGRLVDQKDQLTLLNSINNLKKDLKLEVLIMGDGYNYYSLQNFIEENKLNKLVRIIEFKENPYPYIKSSELFILTSKYEGLPNVLLEAITLKKFIISSDCPTGPREILNQGKYGMLFKTGSPSSLSKKIIEYSKNKKKFIKKTKLAYKSLDRYNLKRNLNEYFVQITKFF